MIALCGSEHHNKRDQAVSACIRAGSEMSTAAIESFFRVSRGRDVNSLLSSSRPLATPRSSSEPTRLSAWSARRAARPRVACDAVPVACQVVSTPRHRALDGTMEDEIRLEGSEGVNNIVSVRPDASVSALAMTGRRRGAGSSGAVDPKYGHSQRRHACHEGHLELEVHQRGPHEASTSLAGCCVRLAAEGRSTPAAN